MSFVRPLVVPQLVASGRNRFVRDGKNVRSILLDVAPETFAPGGPGLQADVLRVSWRTRIDHRAVYGYYAALCQYMVPIKPRRGGWNGGVSMKSPESEVALAAHAGASTTYADKEASPRRAEVAYEERRAVEKPEASEEIVIEEISIDGMCGVY